MDKYLSYEEHDVLKGSTFFAKYDTVVVPNDWPFQSGSWLRVYAGNVVNILEIDPDNDNLVFAMFGKEHGWLYSNLLESILFSEVALFDFSGVIADDQWHPASYLKVCKGDAVKVLHVEENWIYATSEAGERGWLEKRVVDLTDRVPLRCPLRTQGETTDLWL